MLEAILREYEANDLVRNAAITGDFLLEGMTDIMQRNPDMLGRARGDGTFCAISCRNTATRDALVKNLRNKGVVAGGCGAYSIRMRPSLVFMPHHAAQFLTMFDEVCRE